MSARSGETRARVSQTDRVSRCISRVRGSELYSGHRNGCERFGTRLSWLHPRIEIIQSPPSHLQGWRERLVTRQDPQLNSRLGILMAEPTDEELKALFDAFDTSGDGFISHDELAAALQKGGKEVSPEDVAKMLEQVDTNQDGKVSLDEFVQVFKLAPDQLGSGLSQLRDAGMGLLKGVFSPVRAVGRGVSNIASAAVDAITPRPKEFKDMTSTDIKNAIKAAKKEAARRRWAKLHAAEQAIAGMKAGAK